MLLAPARLRSSSSFLNEPMTVLYEHLYIYFKITTTCMLCIHYVAMPRDTLWTLPDLGLVRQNQSPTSHICIYTYPVQTEHNYPPARHLTVRGSYPVLVVIKRNHPLAIHLTVRGVVRATCHSVNV